MTTAYLAISCTTPDGQRGTFLYQPMDGLPRGVFVPVSSVYKDCYEAFPSLRAEGWVKQPYDPAHPCGVYARES